MIIQSLFDCKYKEIIENRKISGNTMTLTNQDNETSPYFIFCGEQLIIPNS